MTIHPRDTTGGHLLDDLYDATAVLDRARNDAEAAEAEWRGVIRKALAAGQRVADIADAAGVTRARIYQIRDDRR